MIALRMKNTWLPTLALLAATLAVAAPAAAQRDDQRSLDAVRQQIAALEERLAQRHAERDRASRALRDSERDVARAAAELERIRGELAAAQAREQALVADTARATERLGAERGALAEQLRMSFMAGRAEGLKLLLSQSSPAELGRMLVYYDYLHRARTDRIGAVTAEIDRLGALRAEGEVVRRRLAALAADQAEQLAAREAAREERRVAIAAAAADIERGDREIEQLRAEEARLAELVRGLNEALAEFPVAADEPFPRLRGQLAWPVRGRIAGDYGRPRDGGPLNWNGVLLEAERGAPVRAVYHGRVVFADWLAGLGLLMILDHGDGFMSLYGHNELLAKEPGEWATPGEVIAQVGDSGGQARPALYFEIRQNGAPVNPRPWFAGPPTAP